MKSVIEKEWQCYDVFSRPGASVSYWWMHMAPIFGKPRVGKPSEVSGECLY